MSILQSYEQHRKMLGDRKVDAIQKYLDFLRQQGIDMEYSDIIYRKRNFEKFKKWYKSQPK